MSRAIVNAWIGVLVVLLAIGIYAIYQQESVGHVVTGLGDWVIWGLYIAFFAFFVGLSAGATVVSSLVYALGMEEYKPIARRSLIVGVASLIGALLFIFVDVGNPLRALLVPVVLRNPTSPFIITSSSYIIFFLFLLAEIYFVMRPKPTPEIAERDKRLVKYFAWAAIFVALWFVHSTTGTVFGFIKAREFWHSPLIPAWFVVSALVSGAALMGIIAYLSPRITGKELLSNAALNHFGKLLALFILVDLYFEFYETATLLYAHKSAEMEAWSFLTGVHPTSPVVFFVPLYIGFQLLPMILAFLILIYPGNRSASRVFVASLLAIVAVMSYRYNFVVAGQIPLLLPGIPPHLYSPTWIEIAASLGVIAFVALLYTIATRVLPMEEASARA